MKVLISGYYGFDNMGDEAILKSIIASLREVNPDIQITVLSNNIEHTKSTYNVDAINRWNIGKIYIELLKSDGLISGGGSLLQDVTSQRPIIYYTSIIALAKIANKRVFVYAQGVGPINSDKGKKMTKKCLNKVDYISLRDEDSIEFIKSIGVNKNIYLVPDPVMGFSIDNYDSNLYEKYNDKNYITVSVRDWDKATVDYKQKLAYCLDKVVESGIDVMFIPMHGEADKNTSQEVMNMMKQNAQIFLHENSIEAKILCIKSSKLMIGMRLHALIFAAIVNTPMIGVSYDPKIDSFLSLVNQPCMGDVYKDWSIDDLYEKSVDIINNSKDIKNELEKKVMDLKERSMLTAVTAIKIFENKGALSDE